MATYTYFQTSAETVTRYSNIVVPSGTTCQTSQASYTHTSPVTSATSGTTTSDAKTYYVQKNTPEGNFHFTDLFYASYAKPITPVYATVLAPQTDSFPPKILVLTPQRVAGFVGFGGGMDTDSPIYESITSASSGDTFDSTDRLNIDTSNSNNIGAITETAGGRLIETSCDGLGDQAGTTAWSVHTDTNIPTTNFSTQSTVLATYSSTTSTSTAEGQPTTSTRTDKFATYTLGMSSRISPVTTIRTGVGGVAVNWPAAVETKGPADNPDGIWTYNLGYSNNITEDRTLLLPLGAYYSLAWSNGESISNIDVLASNFTIEVTSIDPFPPGTDTLTVTRGFYSFPLIKGQDYYIEGRKFWNVTGGAKTSGSGFTFSSGDPYTLASLFTAYRWPRWNSEASEYVGEESTYGFRAGGFITTGYTISTTNTDDASSSTEWVLTRAASVQTITVNLGTTYGRSFETVNTQTTTQTTTTTDTPGDSTSTTSINTTVITKTLVGDNTNYPLISYTANAFKTSQDVTSGSVSDDGNVTYERAAIEWNPYPAGRPPF